MRACCAGSGIWRTPGDEAARHRGGRLLIENGRERRDGFEDRIRRELSEEELAEFRRVLGVVARVMKN